MPSSSKALQNVFSVIAREESHTVWPAAEQVLEITKIPLLILSHVRPNHAFSFLISSCGDARLQDDQLCIPQLLFLLFLFKAKYFFKFKLFFFRKGLKCHFAFLPLTFLLHLMTLFITSFQLLVWIFLTLHVNKLLFYLVFYSLIILFSASLLLCLNSRLYLNSLSLFKFTWEQVYLLYHFPPRCIFSNILFLNLELFLHVSHSKTRFFYTFYLEFSVFNHLCKNHHLHWCGP